jgi:hypothetical protein
VLAVAMHEEAAGAADHMGPHHDTHQTSFGRANVAVHRVTTLVRLHEGGRAVEYAQRIDTTLTRRPGGSPLPPSRPRLLRSLLDTTSGQSCRILRQMAADGGRWH